MWISPLYCMISRLSIHQAPKMSQNMYFTNLPRPWNDSVYNILCRFKNLLSFIKQTYILYKGVCKYHSFNYKQNHTTHGKIEFSLFETEIGNFIKSNRVVTYVTKPLLSRIFYLHHAWSETFACKIIIIDWLIVAGQ